MVRWGVEWSGVGLGWCGAGGRGGGRETAHSAMVNVPVVCVALSPISSEKSARNS